jgi:hypothetical protein
VRAAINVLSVYNFLSKILPLFWGVYFLETLYHRVKKMKISSNKIITLTLNAEIETIGALTDNFLNFLGLL